ncbi:MAG: ligase [Alicyclobacillus sp.]|nr:ligase [Alicyclobacillus sp.]
MNARLDVAAEPLWPQNVEVVWFEDPDDQANTDVDAALGEAVGRGDRPPVVRVWRSARRLGIGVSRKDVATPAGQQAAEQLRALGLTVVVRQTGGTAVPQGPGVVNVSYIFPRPAAATTDAYFRLLCAPLMAWLATWDLAAETGPLPGSYCDGQYNILVNGQKLVGTAQAWRGGLAGVQSTRPGYILAHACLVVDADMAVCCEHINRFYEWAGQDYRVMPETATTLRTLLGPRLPAPGVSGAGLWAAEELVRFFQAKLQQARLRPVERS